jgi:hypothetical protein
MGRTKRLRVEALSLVMRQSHCGATTGTIRTGTLISTDIGIAKKGIGGLKTGDTSLWLCTSAGRIVENFFSFAGMHDYHRRTERVAGGISVPGCGHLNRIASRCLVTCEAERIFSPVPGKSNEGWLIDARGELAQEH